jgi:hypothetical protein
MAYDSQGSEILNNQGKNMNITLLRKIRKLKYNHIKTKELISLIKNILIVDSFNKDIINHII